MEEPFKEQGEEFIPKEDVNFFMRFDKEIYLKSPNESLYFEITDNSGNALHDGLDFSNVSDESLVILGDCLVSILENIIEPELSERSDTYFKEILNKEISSLISKNGMKEGNI